ncbi:helix-turn-helix domain-containing protein [Heliobacterium undosum]|uniref:Helix-turn-helix domain-containing protein n=1 Tax=Heliomicrobium undosum TaxID=121734 RepID=A0A845L6M9_9FIRM|nr:helix-turn-helix transcriptional regulator [Heliomicrobium undosum]MZP31356.1 helix-turn-helix domain-containing protein [Heliomicrobium undosum]
MDTFNARLKHLRTNKGLTQEELANILGVERATLASWETGRREPDFETVKKIAAYFSVSLEQLIGTVNYSQNTSVATIEAALTDDPELLNFFAELKEREDLQLLFKQVRPLSPDGIKKIIRIIKAIEDEEAQED